VSLPLIRVTLVALVSAFAFAGCKSQETPELPEPVTQEGRLPRAPEAAPTVDPTQLPPPACAVVASAGVEEGVAPLEVQFTAEGMCTDAVGEFTWDFGDGSEPTHDQNPVHVYKTPGSYTARITLVDPENKTQDTDEAAVTVTAAK